MGVVTWVRDSAAVCVAVQISLRNPALVTDASIVEASVAIVRVVAVIPAVSIVSAVAVAADTASDAVSPVVESIHEEICETGLAEAFGRRTEPLTLNMPWVC